MKKTCYANDDDMLILNRIASKFRHIQNFVLWEFCVWKIGKKKNEIKLRIIDLEEHLKHKQN